MAYKKIVCGVTASAAAARAALEAASLAKLHGAQLFYVYAVDLDFLKSGRMGNLSQDVIAQSIEKIGKQIVDTAEQIAASEGVKPEKIVRRGTVLDVLEQVMSEQKADLLVLGHEERTFVEKHLFKGDVEDHVQELKARTGAEVKIIQ
ncbi:MAG TPA: universal stress protein [Syntrophales bacterium]|nr:universal stress protein [Syntrophales bacterium]